MEYWIRDVSKSNRVRLALDNPHTYVVVHTGMVVIFGLTH